MHILLSLCGRHSFSHAAGNNRTTLMCPSPWHPVPCTSSSETSAGVRLLSVITWWIWLVVPKPQTLVNWAPTSRSGKAVTDVVHIAWKPGLPEQTALLLAMGSFTLDHHISWAFLLFAFSFYSPVSIQLQITATPRMWTHSGSRDLQQPKHLFPFSWVSSWADGPQTASWLLWVWTGKEREKKAWLYKDIFYFSTFKTKRKETNSRTGCTFTQGFISPASLHCRLFPSTIRNCIEFVFQSEN